MLEERGRLSSRDLVGFRNYCCCNFCCLSVGFGTNFGLKELGGALEVMGCVIL